MFSATVESIFRECDFCKLKGVLEKSIFNKDGWYFCGPCLLEAGYELKKRKAEKILDERPAFKGGFPANEPPLISPGPFRPPASRLPGPPFGTSR